MLLVTKCGWICHILSPLVNKETFCNKEPGRLQSPWQKTWPNRKAISATSQFGLQSFLTQIKRCVIVRRKLHPQVPLSRLSVDGNTTSGTLHNSGHWGLVWRQEDHVRNELRAWMDVASGSRHPLNWAGQSTEVLAKVWSDVLWKEVESQNVWLQV